MSIELKPKSPQIEFELKSQTIGMEHIKAEWERVLREKWAKLLDVNIGDKYTVTKRYCQQFKDTLHQVGEVWTVHEVHSDFVIFLLPHNPDSMLTWVSYVSLKNLQLLDKVQS